MLRSCKGTKQGFSLIETMIVVAIVVILAAITVPHLMSTVTDISLRYSATNFSGLLQTARIQSVRRNTFYTVQQGTFPSGDAAYFVDLPKTGVYANDDPAFPISPSVTVHPGIGSGAPNEGAFIAGLNFTVNPGGSPISFNARGLPCVVAAGVCPQTPGQGFVIFMSKSAALGNIPWVAVVVTSSGHVQIWSCDSAGNWILRD